MLNITYKGKKYVVPYEIDYEIGGDELRGDNTASKIKSLIKTVYEKARFNSDLSIADITGLGFKDIKEEDTQEVKNEQKRKEELLAKIEGGTATVAERWEFSQAEYPNTEKTKLIDAMVKMQLITKEEGDQLKSQL